MGPGRRDRYTRSGTGWVAGEWHEGREGRYYEGNGSLSKGLSRLGTGAVEAGDAVKGQRASLWYLEPSSGLSQSKEGDEK
jgi:hypothetical protein